jgi:orotidine-5'-phosphate decarboxylase
VVGLGECGLVVGAMYPTELADVRRIAGDLPILVLGVGAQGGDAAAARRVTAEPSSSLRIGPIT